MADIKPGDRVRSKCSEGAGIVDYCYEATAIGGQDALSVSWQSMMRSGIAVASVELVEVAHYAAPGVPMIAVTPGLIEALTTVVEHAEGNGQGEWDAVHSLRAAYETIKAALGEVTRG